MAVKRGFEVSIQEPCEERWETMRPEGAGRFCSRCKKTVHHLARMTQDQVELLAMRAAAGEPVCARVTRDTAGELVMLKPEQRTGRRGAAVFSTALAIGLPAAAQSAAGAAPPERDLAVLTGTLRHPDGSPVTSGLIQLASRETGQLQLVVADEIGKFELHANPGTYDLALQTGAEQVRMVSAVDLHAGYQDVGEVLTQKGQYPGLTDLAYTSTGGTLAVGVRWDLRGIFRHPVLFARAMTRRRS